MFLAIQEASEVAFSFDFYNKAVELIGYLPPQYEFIYAIGTVMLLISCFVIILSPVFLIKAIGGK